MRFIDPGGQNGRSKFEMIARFNGFYKDQLYRCCLFKKFSAVKFCADEINFTVSENRFRPYRIQTIDFQAIIGTPIEKHVNLYRV